MNDLAWLSRTKLLVGETGVEKLINAHVLVVGLGGVGSYAAEFVARSGVGEMTIVDGDVVDPSNRNRQLPALATTHGLPKADIMAERLLAINPELKLTVIKDFLTPDKAEAICQAAKYDYVMDCIDSVTPKLYLITSAKKQGLNIVSSMGAGGKVDPTRIKVADLRDTQICRFALYIRKRLKKKGIVTGLITVFSDEPAPKESLMMTDGTNFKKSAYGTISYLPAAFGGACASVVIRHILGQTVKLHKDKSLDLMKKHNLVYEMKQKKKQAVKAVKEVGLEKEDDKKPDDLVWEI